MTAKNIALQDIPLGESIDEDYKKISESDTLGFDKYVQALSEFIYGCGTPMTIAIQGDWGTGKTSLMRLIEAKTKDNVESIWFNTWQYSQLSMGDSLALSFISAIAGSVAGNENSDVSIKVKDFALKLFEFGLRTTTLGGAAVDMAQGVAEKHSARNIDQIQIIKELKEVFREACEKKLEKNDSKDRIVIFIDDLDRIKPSKAIELLETLKIFLDVENCVFVMAMDFNVVKKGLKEMLGSDANDQMTRSFFDKIIQLPFKMPVDVYSIDLYLKSLLKQVHIDVDGKNTDKYKTLLENSIGANPRAAKRLINVLNLMKIVARVHSKEVENSDIILFGLVCLQESFEGLYRYIAVNIKDKDLFITLNTLLGEEPDDDLKKLIIGNNSNDDDDDDDNLQLKKVSKFLEVFLDIIDTNGNKTIDSDEAQVLEQLLGWVSIASIDSISSADETPKKMHPVSKFCHDVKDRFTEESYIQLTNSQKKAYGVIKNDLDLPRGRYREFKINSGRKHFKLRIVSIAPRSEKIIKDLAWQVYVFFTPVQHDYIDLEEIKSKLGNYNADIEDKSIKIDIGSFLLKDDELMKKTVEALVAINEFLPMD